MTLLATVPIVAEKPCTENIGGMNEVYILFALTAVPAWIRRTNMDNICDYDEGFTRREMYEETGRCLRCMVNPKCPYHIKAVKEEYGVNIGGRA